MDRLEANIGRYPIGFRHYENFMNYNKQFPERTIEDYRDDMNSQISYDEYLLLNQKVMIYELTYNPLMVYDMGLDEIDNDDDVEKQRKPEVVV